MWKKYHVNVRPAPPRFEPISEFCSIEVERCLKCRRCVKYSACVYDIYHKRGFDHVQVLDTGDSQCAGCLRCVQECKNNIFSRVRNSRSWSPREGERREASRLEAPGVPR